MGVKVACNYLHPTQTLFSSSPRFSSPTSLFSSITNAGTGKYSTKLLLSKRSSFHEPTIKRRAFNQSLDPMPSNSEEEEEEEEEEFIKRLQELSLELQEDSSNAKTSKSSSFTLPEPPKWINREESIMPNNHADVPLSLRIIQKKKRYNQGTLKEATESAYSSLKKAFSSMVFILRELQSYTLQMIELLHYENLHGVVERVHGELNASFVWLFQQIFSCTPTFMVSVMLLLANFTVYSISTSTTALPSTVSLNPPAVMVELQTKQEQTTCRDEKFGSYWKTEIMYYKLLSEDPDSALILSNLAQFFYLLHHDHDRAEHYFKKAVEVMPKDAEALNRYAKFLWQAKNDLGAAEDKYLEAIDVEPGNSYYAADYAHFLWNTGGEETCYPLDHGSL